MQSQCLFSKLHQIYTSTSKRIRLCQSVHLWCRGPKKKVPNRLLQAKSRHKTKTTRREKKKKVPDEGENHCKGRLNMHLIHSSTRILNHTMPNGKKTVIIGSHSTVLVVVTDIQLVYINIYKTVTLNHNNKSHLSPLS